MVMVAPTNPNTVGGLGVLMVMKYDPTGLARVEITEWPIVSWSVDAATPINPLPVSLGDPLGDAGTPPATGVVKSPQWVAGGLDSVWVPGVGCFTWADFFTWLVNNNGATRKIECSFSIPNLVNIWNDWARDNPTSLVLAT